MRNGTRKIKIVYSERYCTNIGLHVFPINKYREIHQRLVGELHLPSEVFVEPQAATDNDIMLVHTRAYIDKLKNGTLSPSEIAKLELPYSPDLVRAVWLGAGGSILAGRCAVEHGMGIHLGGGFHHSFPDHGEGFCVLNDIAIAVRAVQRNGSAERVVIVDCDVHHGNGTAAIFKDDDRVFTFSIHQEDIYPLYKPRGDMDIGFEHDTGDPEYLEALENNIPRIIEQHHPQLMVYVAGADPYEGDQLGSLTMTMAGLEQRDRLIFNCADRYDLPVCVLLAGGYAVRTADTVAIHFNMIKEALQHCERS